ncbi:PrgI family protein [Patescibacteria group bacterium]
MRYSVPQFIEVEDKVIGPLTVKQFIYILAGVGTLFVIWTISPSIEVFLVPAVPVLGLFLALAFYKINGRPFSVFLQAVLKYLTRPKVSVWRREHAVASIKTDMAAEAAKRKEKEIPMIGKNINENRLRKLSRILNTGGGVDESVYSLPDSAEVSPYEKPSADTREQTLVGREQRVEELLGRK